jgi:hypothetical protein
MRLIVVLDAELAEVDGAEFKKHPILRYCPIYLC